MARFRTFKKVDLTEPEDDDPKVKSLKRNDLAWNVYFDKNEKLYSFYLMAIMTHSFVGLPLMEENFTEQDLKLIFNTAGAMIAHMDKRYKEDVRDMIIKLSLPLTANPTSLLNDFLTVYNNKKPSEIFGKPMPLSDNIKTAFDWGLVDRARREFAVLERVGNITGDVYVALLYELLWFYYHDEFSPNSFRHAQIIKEYRILF